MTEIKEIRNADIHDLELELWLRKREAGEIVWRTKDKKEIPIKELSTAHIKNIINKYLEVEQLRTHLEDSENIR